MNNLPLQLELQFIIEDFIFDLKNRNNIPPILIENVLKNILLKIQDEVRNDLLLSFKQIESNKEKNEVKPTEETVLE